MAAQSASDGRPVPGPDGQLRCPWSVASIDYRAYHDDEWGRPVRGDRALFERICLEGFQAGLSWLTILRKRAAFRQAFAGFDPEAVAAYDDADVARLAADVGIVRNRAKIIATIGNARALLRMWEVEGQGSLDDLVWSVQIGPRPRPVTTHEVPTATTESAGLSRELRGRGFAFVGPTTCYAAMQACGVVDDHLTGCWVPPATSPAAPEPG